MVKEKIKNPKIVLVQISGNVDGYWGNYPPLGLASIATYAIKYGKIPKRYFTILDSNLPHFMAIIKAIKPDIIGFSTFSNNYYASVGIAKKCKKALPGSLFIIGGVHITLFPETIDPVFDFACLGEGEETFLEILEIWRKNGNSISSYFECKGIFYRKRNRFIRTSDRDLIYPLDKIPSIDLSLLPSVFFRREIVRDNKTGVWKDHKVFPLFTSRGCPYHCVFCARSALWRNVRYFSEKRVGHDVAVLRNKYNVTAIQIWDDLFTMSIPRLRLIEKNLTMRKVLKKICFYRVFARTDLFTLKMARQLERLNVKSVAFGLESGSERILNYLKKNTTKLKNNFDAVSLCEKENMGFVACIMIGIPTETVKDMNDTYKFIKYIYKLKTLEIIDSARATPFPGTELYDYAIREKLIPKNYFQISESLSLNDIKNDKPLLIRDKKTVKYYRQYWKKIKEYETKLWLRNTKQKGYKPSMFRLNFTNLLNKKTFLPFFLIKQILINNMGSKNSYSFSKKNR